jgi:putative membrane protein
VLTEPVDGRRPRWVYDEGVEPDARISLANERTFLAWMRTALALVAGGVAIHAIDVPLSSAWKSVVSTLLLLAGVLATTAAWVQWARTERAVRRGEPLPSRGPLTVLIAAVVGATAVLLLVGLL